jgi:hypothetical protein
MKQINNRREDGILILNRRIEMRKLIVMLTPLICLIWTRGRDIDKRDVEGTEFADGTVRMRWQIRQAANDASFDLFERRAA